MAVRVLHLIGGGEIGGAELHVLHLLQSYDKARVTPFLICLVPESPFAALAGSHGFISKLFPMRFPLDLSPVISVILFCRKNNITLIHSHGTRANLIGRIAARIARLPCISTVHSLPKYDYTFSLKARISLASDNLTLPLSAGLITVSSHVREVMLQRLKYLSLSLPLKTIYNGLPRLDFASKSDLRRGLRHEWGIPENSVVIGSIGRLHPVKGQTYLIEAMKLLSKETPNVHLLLIGDGPLHAQLNEELISSGLSFTLTGYQSSAWRYLPAMDLFVLPSLSEGMGLVLLEAAQAGIPIVASKVGGIPELLEDRVEALLVRPAEPLELTLACSQILQDQGLADKLTANAAARTRLFSLEKMTEDTTIFYEELNL